MKFFLALAVVTALLIPSASASDHYARFDDPSQCVTTYGGGTSCMTSSTDVRYRTFWVGSQRDGKFAPCFVLMTDTGSVAMDCRWKP